MVFQQLGLATDFQTPLLLHPLKGTEQRRATQALGLLPDWHFCSQDAWSCEHELREARHPSCAAAI
ncbi:conserved hypothetical protein [Hyphomicrobiales bacterium]|nr:conserved hypothetical protein [Hyphomicrobiales bacterium]CAH1697223.1 conserved hypothetical protein [Hyphomicrobiales bacterium]CAI0342791.1 conserved hypothetical protein [Hyphomicrobiales bacterium]